jgi:DNA-binding PadR family transcriptional regulator
LLEALKNALRAEEEDSGALTTKEIKRATGMSISRIRGALKKMKDEGGIEVVWKKQENLSGNNSSVPAYRLMGGEGE